MTQRRNLNTFASLEEVRKYIYLMTHNDFKGGGDEIMMFRRDIGTTIVNIYDLTLEELADQLITKVNFGYDKGFDKILDYLKKLN